MGAKPLIEQLRPPTLNEHLRKYHLLWCGTLIIGTGSRTGSLPDEDSILNLVEGILVGLGVEYRSISIGYLSLSIGYLL